MPAMRRTDRSRESRRLMSRRHPRLSASEACLVILYEIYLARGPAFWASVSEITRIYNESRLRDMMGAGGSRNAASINAALNSRNGRSPPTRYHWFDFREGSGLMDGWKWRRWRVTDQGILTAESLIERLGVSLPRLRPETRPGKVTGLGR